MKSSPDQATAIRLGHALGRLSSKSAVVAIVLGFTILAQTWPSMYATSVTVGIFALIAVPLGLLYGQSGTISLAQASLAAIGAYTTAILTTQTGWNPWLTLVPAMVLPAAFAYVIARPMLRLPELSLALATLALGLVLTVVFERGGDLTNGFVGISGIDPIPGVGVSRVRAHLLVWVFVFLVVAGYRRLMNTSRGRSLNSIRVDRLLARSLGANVAAELAQLFALTAGLAGLAGWFYAHYFGYLAPESLGLVASANILFMVVLGGRRSAVGPIVGAIVFTLARDILPGTVSQGMFFGSMLIIILMLLPDGLLSLSFGGWMERLRGVGPGGSEQDLQQDDLHGGFAPGDRPETREGAGL